MLRKGNPDRLSIITRPYSYAPTCACISLPPKKTPSVKHLSVPCGAQCCSLLRWLSQDEMLMLLGRASLSQEDTKKKEMSVVIMCDLSIRNIHRAARCTPVTKPNATQSRKKRVACHVMSCTPYGHMDTVHMRSIIKPNMTFCPWIYSRGRWDGCYSGRRSGPHLRAAILLRILGKRMFL